MGFGVGFRVGFKVGFRLGFRVGCRHCSGLYGAWPGVLKTRWRMARSPRTRGSKAAQKASETALQPFSLGVFAQSVFLHWRIGVFLRSLFFTDRRFCHNRCFSQRGVLPGPFLARCFGGLKSVKLSPNRCCGGGRRSKLCARCFERNSVHDVFSLNWIL